APRLSASSRYCTTRNFARIICSVPIADLPFFSYMLSQLPISTLFPYTTLFRSSARPRFPTLADRLGVTVYIDFFQPFDAVFHRFSRFFIFFPGRFEQRPQERQRKQAPIEISQR